MLKYNLKLFSHTNLLNDFVNLNSVNKLPSKILLTGQEGIGKFTFALHFINYLFSKNDKFKYNLSENLINTQSVSYNLINNLSHPNFYLISKNDDKKTIEIDQVRKMIDFINKSTFNEDKKIILIDGVENLNLNSANALLKSLEDSNADNLFILIHNHNKNIPDTIKSRCISYKLNFNFLDIDSVLSNYFKENIYKNLNNDFNHSPLSPKFIIRHINFINENNLDIKNYNIEKTIKFIIEKKAYKKNSFISNNFQNYIEIYFTKMYSMTKDYKYYNNLIKTVTETNLINKFNLDLDSFFIKFEDKYLNI